MAESLSVLLVAHEIQLLRALRDTLEVRGYVVGTARTGEEALALVQGWESPPALAVVDLTLPDMDGLALVSRLLSLSDWTETVILTGHATPDVVEAMQKQGIDVLTKPVEPPSLLASLERAGERWHRKVAEDALGESESRLRRLFQVIGDAIFVVDARGLILEVNPAALDLTGGSLDDIEGRSISELLSPATGFDGVGPPPLTEAGDGAIGEYLIGGTDRRIVRVEVRTAFLSTDRVIHSARDLTERRRLEEQIHKSERMEVVGRLAGGIAHDFNNVLTTITGYAELLSVDLKDDPNATEALQEVLRAAQRASRLTKELLAFSRRQIFQPHVLDANEVISEIQGTLRRCARGDVAFQVELGEIGPVRVDKGQLERVLVNLVVNASDAMPEGGRLTVSTAAVTLTEEAAGEFPFEIPPGEYVALAVTDSGIGMEPEALERVFEPFYSSRELGQGSGLGLATTYGVVKQSGGYIHAESRPGEETRFTIYLPRVESALDGAEAAGARPNRVTNGPATVLVAEDDRTVRTFMRRALELHGYHVLEAADAPEALKVVQSHLGPIDLLITDLLVPGAPHHGLAADVAELRPGTPVILSSGHEREATDRGDLRGMAGILDKPFTIEQLIHVVRSVLGG